MLFLTLTLQFLHNVTQKNYYKRKKEVIDILQKAALAAQKEARDDVISSASGTASNIVDVEEHDHTPLLEHLHAQKVNLMDAKGFRNDCTSEGNASHSNSAQWHISDEESEEEFIDCESEISSDEDEAAAQEFDAQYTSDVFSDLKKSLAEWMHKHNITHSAMDELLTLSNTLHLEDNLPRTSRTIVGTPRTVSLTERSENSRYHYFGMKHSLRKILNKNGGKLSKVSMIINVDGLPVYKSSTV